MNAHATAIAGTMPDFEGAITKKAMLVSLTIKMPTTAKKDKDASKETTASHHADEEAAHVTKKLYAKEVTQDFKSAANEARSVYYDATLNWGQDGSRILLAAGYFDLINKINPLENQFWKSVEVFLEKVDDLEASERQRLGSLYKEEDYASREKLQSKFAFELKFFPLMDSNDWRVKLNEEEELRIKESTRKMLEASYREATKDPWLRLKNVIDKMAERLGEDNNRFHKTLVTNIEDLCDLLPSLNLTNDPMLNQIAQEVRKRLTSHQAEDLRRDPALRRTTAEEASKLSKLVDDYAGVL